MMASKQKNTVRSIGVTSQKTMETTVDKKLKIDYYEFKANMKNFHKFPISKSDESVFSFGTVFADFYISTL